MEKLGVVEGVDQESLEKQAAQGCPACGSTLVKLGQILKCPVHGTEPFESKEIHGGEEGSNQRKG